MVMEVGRKPHAMLSPPRLLTIPFPSISGAAGGAAKAATELSRTSASTLTEYVSPALHVRGCLFADISAPEVFFSLHGGLCWACRGYVHFDNTVDGLATSGKSLDGSAAKGELFGVFSMRGLGFQAEHERLLCNLTGTGVGQYIRSLPHGS